LLFCFLVTQERRVPGSGHPGPPGPAAALTRSAAHAAGIEDTVAGRIIDVIVDVIIDVISL
jgi:hypothetical protein